MSAPVEDRAAWQRHMAQLALHAGQALLARVQAGAGDAGERIDTLRAAIAWFESGLTVADVRRGGECAVAAPGVSRRATVAARGAGRRGLPVAGAGVVPGDARRHVRRRGRSA